MTEIIQIKNAKIWETGNSFVITIPLQYIRNELIDLTKLYDVTFKEAKEDE